MAPKSQPGRATAGFTLMELVVVLFIIGLLAAIAAPNISGAIQRGREAALLENLAVMRRSIDDFHADRSAYPATLEVLVDERYLRFVPDDPVAEKDAGWRLIYDERGAGVIDIHSTSDDMGQNGVPYREW